MSHKQNLLLMLCYWFHLTLLTSALPTLYQTVTEVRQIPKYAQGDFVTLVFISNCVKFYNEQLGTTQFLKMCS